MDALVRTKTVQNFFFGLSLFMIILYPKHLYLGKLAWVLFIMLTAMNTNYIVYSVFFFSAFFSSTGFFPHVFFTIKHFHIAMLFFGLIQLLKGEWWPKAGGDKLASLKPYICWLIIVGISSLSALSGNEIVKVMRTNGNLISLVFASSFLIWFINNEFIFLNSLKFFVFGSCLRIVLATMNGWHIWIHDWYEVLTYNNHIGFLATASFFIALAILLSQKSWLSKFLYGTSVLIVFFGVLFSCSRTGWVSLIVSYFLFVLIWIKSKRQKMNWLISVSIILPLFCFLLIIALISLYNYDVFGRVSGTLRLLKLDYWWYTLQDKDNFGFLGWFRLRQLLAVGKIMQNNLVAGIGFTKEATDFHSLYLTLLGGSGLLGLGLFFIFSIQWLGPLFKRVFTYEDGFHLIRIGTISAFSTWLLYSFMESFILQFHIWIILIIGSVLTFIGNKEETYIEA